MTLSHLLTLMPAHNIGRHTLISRLPPIEAFDALVTPYIHQAVACLIFTRSYAFSLSYAMLRYYDVIR